MHDFHRFRTISLCYSYWILDLPKRPSARPWTHCAIITNFTCFSPLGPRFAYDMDKKKQRPYSEYEKQLLMQLVSAKIDTIENRRTDGITQKKKLETWEDITSQFNNSPNVDHIADIKQIKKMWQNIKSKARDAKTLEIQRKRTGGGPPPPEMGPMESQVIAMMPNIMPTIAVPIDSDTIGGGPDNQEDNDSLFWMPKRLRQESPVELEENNTIIINDENVCETPPGPSVEVPFKIISEPGPSRATDGRQAKPIKKIKEKKSLDDLKNDLLLQEIAQNKIKFQMEMDFLKEKYNSEMEFLRAKQKIELEILEIKKNKELEK